MDSSSPASRRRRGLCLLAEAEPGEGYRVSGIYERDRKLLEFLEARGIRPGARITVADRNYDETVTLRTDAGSFSLGGAATTRVWITQEKRRNAS